MKKFLKLLISFIVLTVIIFSVISCFYLNYKQQYLKDENFKLPKHINTLLAGDSHALCSFDDEKILLSKNIAFSGEHFMFTYVKLRKIISANPSIRNVVLSIGTHNFSINEDDKLFNDATNNRLFARYFMLLNDQEIMECQSNSMNWRINYLKKNYGIPFQLKLEMKLLLKAITNSQINFDDFPFIETISRNNISKVEKPEITIQNHYYNNKKLSEPVVLNKKYLKLIAKYLNDSNKNLILINTPVHFIYKQQIPKNMILEQIHTIYQLKQEYKNVKYYDYSSLKLPTNYFKDNDHLNLAGAEKFSVMVNKLLVDK